MGPATMTDSCKVNEKVPKSTNQERIRLNMDLFSFEIDKGDMSAIEDMDRGDGIAWASGDSSMIT